MKKFLPYAIVAVIFLIVGLIAPSVQSNFTCSRDLWTAESRLRNGCAVLLGWSASYQVGSLTIRTDTSKLMQVEKLPDWILATSSGGTPSRDYTVVLLDSGWNGSVLDDIGLGYIIKTYSTEQITQEFLTALVLNSLMDKNPTWSNTDLLLTEARIRARAWTAAIGRKNYDDYAKNDPTPVSYEAYQYMKQVAKSLPQPIVFR